MGKYVALFGTLFNEVRIQRFTPEGEVKEELRIPLKYAPKEKMMSRVDADPNLDRPEAVILPVMSFTHGDPRYDGPRSMNQIGQSVLVVDGDEYKRQYNPIAYDIPFSLHIYGKNASDVHKIFEQVITPFRPEFTVTAELIPTMNETRDIPIVLENVVTTDNWDSAYVERRAIVWTLNFTMKAWFYGPVHEHPVIKFVDVKFYDATKHDSISDAVGNTAAIDRVTVQPGLLANGSPTTNAAASIPYAEIEEDDDWGYATVIYGSLVPSDGTGGADEPVEYD
jgi:hypothetical protein